MVNVPCLTESLEQILGGAHKASFSISLFQSNTVSAAWTVGEDLEQRGTTEAGPSLRTGVGGWLWVAPEAMEDTISTLDQKLGEVPSSVLPSPCPLLADCLLT